MVRSRRIPSRLGVGVSLKAFEERERGEGGRERVGRREREERKERMTKERQRE